jgi:hypothetical protein
MVCVGAYKLEWLITEVEQLVHLGSILHRICCSTASSPQAAGARQSLSSEYANVRISQAADKIFFLLASDQMIISASNVHLLPCFVSRQVSIGTLTSTTDKQGTVSYVSGSAAQQVSARCLLLLLERSDSSDCYSITTVNPDDYE